MRDAVLAGASMSVEQAVELWLNGREPVTVYTLSNYEYRAEHIKNYAWGKSLRELTPPDIVNFRASLLRSGISRDLAGKVLSSFQSVMKKMVSRGHIATNYAAGIGIRDTSHYDEPVVIPSIADIKALLKAADELANAKNRVISKA